MNSSLSAFCFLLLSDIIEHYFKNHYCLIITIIRLITTVTKRFDTNVDRHRIHMIHDCDNMCAVKWDQSALYSYYSLYHISTRFWDQIFFANLRSILLSNRQKTLHRSSCRKLPVTFTVFFPGEKPQWKKKKMRWKNNGYNFPTICASSFWLAGSKWPQAFASHGYPDARGCLCTVSIINNFGARRMARQADLHPLSPLPSLLFVE